jgi:hypothetical protein
MIYHNKAQMKNFKDIIIWQRYSMNCGETFDKEEACPHLRLSS